MLPSRPVALYSKHFQVSAEFRRGIRLTLRLGEKTAKRGKAVVFRVAIAYLWTLVYSIDRLYGEVSRTLR
jgi:hypothetical protein